MPKLARILAWTLVAAIAFVTLAPIGLRPVVADSANLERALAYMLLGLLFGLAYPRHWVLAAFVGVAVAAGLEAGQMLTESRHGRIADFLVKALAAGFGSAMARALLAVQVEVDRRLELPRSRRMRSERRELAGARPVASVAKRATR